jgi:uncharacterized membrane protein YkvA (DUF1232 family)
VLSEDIVVRMGGDEFIIILGCRSQEVLDHTIERLKTAFLQYNSSSGKNYKLECSFGADIFNLKYNGIKQFLHHIDSLMYREKKIKRIWFRFKLLTKINISRWTLKLKERAKQLKTDIPAVFIALGKKRTPFLAKVLAALTVGYALSPIDLIPDFIPILGYLDDVIILPVLISVTIRLIPKELLLVCREEAKDLWKNGKPKRWFFAVPIFVIWAVVIWLLYRMIKFTF